MRDYLDIGEVPYGEDCEQVPYSDPRKARLECRVYIRQLRRMFGDEPPFTQLAVKSNPHEFGTYFSVICFYNDEDKDSVDYAFKCEGEGPEHWDEEAKVELAAYSPPGKEVEG